MQDSERVSGPLKPQCKHWSSEGFPRSRRHAFVLASHTYTPAFSDRRSCRPTILSKNYARCLVELLENPRCSQVLSVCFSHRMTAEFRRFSDLNFSDQPNCRPFASDCLRCSQVLLVCSSNDDGSVFTSSLFGLLMSPHRPTIPQVCPLLSWSSDNPHGRQVLLICSSNDDGRVSTSSLFGL